MIHAWFGAIYPLNCLGCESPIVRGEHLICTHCIGGFVSLPFTQNGCPPVQQLFWGKADVFTAVSLFSYVKSEKLSRLIHEFKYKNHPKLGKRLGQELSANFSNIFEFNDADLISYVPMFPKKEKQRGYNQAKVLADELGKRKNINCNCILKRVEKSDSQTTLDVYGRYENMLLNFEVLNGFDNINHVVLVDDVITTGATLSACINLIKEKYNCKVSVYTLAFRDI